MIDEQWKEFEAKQDWSYHNRHNWPTFEECFKQGVKVGLSIKEDLKQAIEETRGDYCEGIE